MPGEDRPTDKPALSASTSTHSLSLSHTSVVSDISSAVSVVNCRICLSTTLDPAALATCGHKFCEKCLDKYWRLRDKPNFIVCPLCRNNAYNIAFSKKDSISSTKDLRSKFNAIQEVDESSGVINPSVISIQKDSISSTKDLRSKFNAIQEVDESSGVINPSVISIQVGLIITALYLVGKWFKSPLQSLIKSMMEYLLEL